MAFEPSYGLVSAVSELEDIAARITQDGRPFAFDFETGYHGDSRKKRSLRVGENFIVGFSLTNSLKWSRYVPLRHDTGANLDYDECAAALWKLLNLRDADGRPLGVAHGAKTVELRTARRWFEARLGVPCGYYELFSDTLLESYAEASNREHALKDITKLNFGHVMLELEDLFPAKLTKKEKDAIRFNVLDPHDPRVIHYGCEDALWTLGHHRMRYPKVKDSFIYKLEMACLPVVCAMEDTGVWYDWNAMREWAVRAKDFAALYLEEVREDFAALSGKELPPTFNFGSSQQLARLLYEDCGMPIRKRTKTGRPGTDAKVALKGLSKEYNEVRRLLEWKRITKLYRDYMEHFEDDYCYPEDGRAHPNFIQHGVPSGRFGCSDPNVQQAPKKYHYELRDGTVFDLNYRTLIGAPPGYYQLGFDLAQAELRAVAGMAHEEKMFAAFEQGIDVHSVTSSLIYAVPVPEVTPDQRDVGKTMGLALVYGLTEEGLAERLGITRAESEELFLAYHGAYPRIKEWTDATVKQSRIDGFVRTWWGRKVIIWQYKDAETAPYKRAKGLIREGQRTAGNAPVQGSATGDYMKIAMVRSDEALRRAGLSDVVKLAMNVHDALEWYVRRDIPPAVVIQALQPAVIFPVKGWPPMLAEWHIGERWGKVHELELLPDGSVKVVQKDKKRDEPTIEAEEDEEAPAPAPRLAALPVPRTGGYGSPAVPVPDPGSYAGPARTVVIEVPAPPPADAIQRLLTYCRARSGPNTVVLRMPGGDARMDFTTSLVPAAQAEVSVLLGGAIVRYDEASVDMAEVGAGIVL